MNDDHTKLLAEFRVLAETVLSRIEPIVAQMAEGRTNVSADVESSEELPAFSGCSWCPVCALAALMRGEHHELLAVLAGHVAVILALLRELLDEFSADRVNRAVVLTVACRRRTVPHRRSLARRPSFRSP